MSAKREPGQAGLRHMLLCLPSTLQQCWTLEAFLSTPLQESSKLRWAMPLVLGTAGQKQSSPCWADCKAREAARGAGDAHQWVLPHPPQAASREGQEKQGAGEPLTWPSNHWGGSL